MLSYRWLSLRRARWLISCGVWCLRPQIQCCQRKIGKYNNTVRSCGCCSSNSNDGDVGDKSRDKRRLVLSSRSAARYVLVCVCVPEWAREFGNKDVAWISEHLWIHNFCITDRERSSWAWYRDSFQHHICASTIAYPDADADSAAIREGSGLCLLRSL